MYEGVEPLTPDEIADCVLFALTRPLHVNVDEIVVKALAQSSGGPDRAPRGVAVASMLTILEGSTFCICDERGDIVEETSGLFAYDTRFLSRLVLRVGGSPAAAALLGPHRPLRGRVLSCATRPSTGLPHDSVSVARERFVATGMQERIAVRNESMETLEFELSARARGRLRGHHLGEAPRLRARRSRARAAAAAAGAGRVRRGERGS